MILINLILAGIFGLFSKNGWLKSIKHQKAGLKRLLTYQKKGSKKNGLW